MPTLSDIVLAEHQREAAIADCVKAVERHLSGLKSLRGVALKAGLAMFKTAIPDAVPRLVRRLLPDLLVALEPLHQRFRLSTDRDFSLFLRKHSGEAADAMITAIDARAQTAHNETVKGAYARLRGQVRAELEAALPELSKAVSSYLD